MPTYVLLSNLTDEGAKALKANPKRLQEVNKEIEKFGAKVTAQYAVLGPYDFVSIVDCPDNETIARVSVELANASYNPGVLAKAVGGLLRTPPQLDTGHVARSRVSVGRFS